MVLIDLTWTCDGDVDGMDLAKVRPATGGRRRLAAQAVRQASGIGKCSYGAGAGVEQLELDPVGTPRRASFGGGEGSAPRSRNDASTPAPIDAVANAACCELLGDRHGCNEPGRQTWQQRECMVERASRASLSRAENRR